MGIPTGFPLYFDGIYHFSLSIPAKKQSEISKGIGVTASYPLLIPNVDFLKKFVAGEIGISDKVTSSALLKSFSNPTAQKDEKVFKAFAKSTEQNITDAKKYKKGDKYKLPKEEIKIPTGDGNGLKGFEKTTLKSIFETQKPYFEVVKLIIGNIAKIEDICARVLPLVSASPLTTESQKPINNGGVQGGRPKAMGFGGGAELKSALSQLEGIKKFGGETKLDKDGKATRTKTTQSATASTTGGGNDSNWKIVSTIYSTGSFDPKVNYRYIYIDLPPEVDIKSEDSNLNLENSDPFQKYKPKNLIFGIFNSEGVPLNPNEKLKSLGITDKPEETPFKKAEWILKSKKWYFPEGQYTWPTLGSPTYTWKRGLSEKNSKSKPDGDPEWSLKRYKKGDKNLISGADAIEGDPVIVSFDTSDTTPHSKFFNDLVKIKMNSSDLEEKDKVEYSKQILNQFNTKSHVENVFNYGQSKASVYKPVNGKSAYPDKIKLSFLPYQIKVNEAASDPKLKAFAKKNGTDPSLVWVDPEADYELKVIRVDPITTIDYVEAAGETVVKKEIKTFIKNRAVFKLSNGETFDISIQKGSGTPQIFEDLTFYNFENWNYENPGTLLDNQMPKIVDTNIYTIMITSKSPIGEFSNSSFTKKDIFLNSLSHRIFKDGSKYFLKSVTTSNGVETLGDVVNDTYIIGDGTSNSQYIRFETQNSEIIKWYYLHGETIFDKSNLPAFGNEKTFLVDLAQATDTNGNWTFTTTSKTIPKFQIKVSSDSPNGTLIDPTKITNDQLKGSQLFSKGKYGFGSSVNPQSIDVIKRYMLTDLDFESYYIIEGVLTSENTSNVGSGVGSAAGGDNYRLPHAIGATTVFLGLLVDIFSQLVPAIQKLLKLFKGPQSFIIDILTEKLGEGFSFFSKEAKDTIAKANKIKEQNEKLTKQPQPNSTTPNVKLDDKANKSSIPNSTPNSEKIDKMKKHFSDSPLRNHVFVNNKGDFSFLLNGAAVIPFTIFGKKLDFGANLKLEDEKKPLELITSLKDAKVKNLQNFLKGSLKTFKPTGSDGKAAPLQISDIKRATKADKTPDFSYDTGLKNVNDYKIVDVKYSTGVYIRGIDYNYIYINKDNEKLIREADDILGQNVDLLNPGDVQKTIDDLENAQKDDPTNATLKDKIDKLKEKLNSIGDTSQPLVKMLLGLVTLPIKIIASIVEWILDFFKSLVNPLTLPVKIAEFLSFSWILNLVTPKGILEMVGIVFKPEKLLEWKSLVSVPNPKIKVSDSVTLPTGDTSKLPNLKTGTAPPKQISIKSKLKYKEADPEDKFLIPDDTEMVPLYEFFSAPFLPKLPTYTARQFRKNPNIALKIASPLLCLLEKIFNAIIEFIWSTLGIEALIDCPKIKLCPESENPEDLIGLLDGTKIGATSSQSKPNNDGSSSDNFIYEIKLSDGRVIKDLDRVKLQEFINNNKDVSFEYKF